MLQRMIRAARLDLDLYETVEADRGYTGEAFTIVVVTALLSGIGLWIGKAVGTIIIGWIVYVVARGILGWIF